ncbi:DUF742 domain-containing protein [Rhodococcus sp. AD45-ID]|jgi:hypothetical protein|uniref:Uncharacterized protein DUF742 n=2 Tax=Nocardiaceae TaxID=85025 RepID=A0A652YTI2_NOCGL|nr:MULTISPECIES: DUF742 domain-containing protein [Rhodococcus]NMD61118.1 DUF742 domain-containing protein [Nocardia globerula]KJF21246.1 hypothetical protein SZ00_04452 [Rhodococcus sp. AD45]MCE4268495.1 DUF742 domain-containing protein [Rhodococcus globerulus]MDV6266051.1 DUF742 domain-containing protein [Rhodococcus globerulus]MDV8068621.1 DUF742 domain-containing protein [Rhodococcus sp. IEGM 1366]
MSNHPERVDPEPSLVRPYALTEGRTQPSIDLPIEAIVATMEDAVAGRLAPEDIRTSIVSLCEQRISIAEIGAHLGVPIGVARVLVADLIVAGALEVQATLRSDATAVERRELIERTLSGLRAL